MPSRAEILSASAAKVDQARAALYGVADEVVSGKRKIESIRGLAVHDLQPSAERFSLLFEAQENLASADALLSREAWRFGKAVEWKELLDESCDNEDGFL